MKMKDKQLQQATSQGDDSIHSALDLWRLMGGESHRVGEKDKNHPDSMLAAYGDRFTYTFILDDEVASIHFDRKRSEIFFKGHNIKHLELTKDQLRALEHVKGVIKGDSKADAFYDEYCATLDRFLADNKNRGSR